MQELAWSGIHTLRRGRLRSRGLPVVAVESAFRAGRKEGRWVGGRDVPPWWVWEGWQEGRSRVRDMG